jgi:hypothetical protein
MSHPQIRDDSCLMLCWTMPFGQQAVGFRLWGSNIWNVWLERAFAVAGQAWVGDRGDLHGVFRSYGCVLEGSRVAGGLRALGAMPGKGFMRPFLRQRHWPRSRPVTSWSFSCQVCSSGFGGTFTSTPKLSKVGLPEGLLQHSICENAP